VIYRRAGFARRVGRSPTYEMRRHCLQICNPQ